MPKHILADTSCLILLEKIKRISWLHELFGTMVVVSEVADEYGAALPNWIEVRELTERSRLLSFLSENLGKGEAASIALALELENPLLILDDQKARKRAASLDLRNAEKINHQSLRRDFVRRQGRKAEPSELGEGFLTQDSCKRSSKNVELFLKRS